MMESLLTETSPKETMLAALSSAVRNMWSSIVTAWGFLFRWWFLFYSARTVFLWVKSNVDFTASSVSDKPLALLTLRDIGSVLGTVGMFITIMCLIPPALGWLWDYFIEREKPVNYKLWAGFSLVFYTLRACYEAVIK